MSASASPSAFLCPPPVSIVTYTPIALTRKFSALTPSLTSKVEEVMHSQDWVLNQESKLDMGYVSTDSDLLSPMFTPLVKLEVDHESPAFQHAFSTLKEIGLKLQGLNLRLYQTGIATLQAILAPASQEQLTLCWQKVENRDIEQRLSLILQAAGGVMINLLNTTFDTLSKRCKLLTSELTDNDAVLWTGRCYITRVPESAEEAKQAFSIIHECPPSNYENDEAFFRSGNCLFLNNDISLSLDNRRVLFLLQHYNAMLYAYQQSMSNAYHQLQSLKALSSGRRRKALEKLIQRMVSIRTLEYIRLEFCDSLRGLQGSRKPLANALIDAWEINAVEESLLDRAAYINNAITSYENQLNRAINKSIEVILMLIGGISLVDITNNFVAASQSVKHDSTWGIYDIFSLMSSENTVNLALIAVLLMALLFAKNK